MENKIKHLQMISRIIERMAKNSFTIKGWTVSLSTLLFTLTGLLNNNYIYYIIPIIPVLIFWVLDSYYLSIERKYRNLYNEVSLKKDIEINFSMKVSNDNSIANFIKSLFSLTEILFYIPLLIVILAITLTIIL